MSTRNAKRKYLLRGLIKCSICGLTYCGTPGSTGHENAYYKCGGKIAYRGKLQGRCPSKPVSFEEIEDQVWADIVGFTHNPGHVLEDLETQLRESPSTRELIKAKLTDLGACLRAKDRESDDVVRLYRRGRISEQAVDVQLAEVTREADVIRDQQARLCGQLQEQVDREAKLLEADALLKRLNDRVEASDWETKRKLVETLVAKVLVTTMGEGRDRRAEVDVTTGLKQFHARTSTMCPRIGTEFLQEEKRTLGSFWFEQEYLCRFLDAGRFA